MAWLDATVAGLGLAAVAACRAPAPRFVLGPDSSLVDEALVGTLLGLGPGDSVRVEASFRDDLGQTWSSRAGFVADAQGTVDLATSRPINGSYVDPDPMGLFWSMRVAGDGPAAALPVFADPTSSLRPLVVGLVAMVGDSAAARDTVVRLLLTPTVRRTEVREGGLVGTLFVPEASGPVPAALVVTGSSGGLAWALQVAAVIASRGRASLALAYFDWRGQDGLPNEITEVPLEYFTRAIDRLAASPGVTIDDLAAIGISKGGELVLLLATVEPRIRRVVSFVGSSVVWEATRARPATGRQSSWTHGGRPFPFVPFQPDQAFYETFDRRLLLAPHRAALRDSAAVRRAAIPVERIAGPILLVSSDKDEVWPSAEMSDQVIARRIRFGHRDDHHLRFEDGGHVFGVPYLPVFALAEQDRATAARAERDAWTEMRRFLKAP